MFEHHEQQHPMISGHFQRAVALPPSALYKGAPIVSPLESYTPTEKNACSRVSTWCLPYHEETCYRGVPLALTPSTISSRSSVFFFECFFFSRAIHLVRVIPFWLINPKARGLWFKDHTVNWNTTPAFVIINDFLKKRKRHHSSTATTVVIVEARPEGEPVGNKQNAFSRVSACCFVLPKAFAYSTEANACNTSTNNMSAPDAVNTRHCSRQRTQKEAWQIVLCLGRKKKYYYNMKCIYMSRHQISCSTSHSSVNMFTW